MHVEWATPEKVEGHGQERGNSGVFMMGLYEIQILDSYDNPTYFDGQAAAVYKQHPPLVNACRKPGQWQTYDIVFKAPRFDGEGKLAAAGVRHGASERRAGAEPFRDSRDYGLGPAPKYTAHPAKLPLALQYHGNPVRFRNIWIRELPPSDAPLPGKR